MLAHLLRVRLPSSRARAEHATGQRQQHRKNVDNLHELHIFLTLFGKRSSRTYIIYQLHTSRTVHLHHTISVPNALLLVHT